jgi:hypothetical protein
MAFRQVARKPAAFEIDWEDRFDVLPWTEDKTEDIAQFLLNAGTRSFAELSECADGTPESARRYVTRARKYMQEELHGDEVGYAASEVQEFLHSAGFPCPQVLCRPAALGPGCITVEDFVARGRHADAHEPGVRRAMAEALSEQIVRSSRFIELGDLPRRKPSTLDGLWPEPHNALFDFRGTAEGAAWIDRIARRSYAQLDTVPHPPVVGHSDWSAKHFRFEGCAVAIIYDWDSLLLNDEYRTVGGAAATFPCNWYLDVPKVPTPEESVLFVQEYEGARGRRFSREEHRWICAAATYCMAYGARCEHAIDPAGRNIAGSFREALGAAETGNYFET